MRRTVAFLVSLVLLVASGLVHGYWTDRWQRSDELEKAVALVDQVPLKIGAWQGAAAEAEAEAFAQAGALGYWVRTYSNPTTKESVLAILMCGRAGRMAVHTPEVCYSGAGFEMMNQPARVVIHEKTSASESAFWSARFTKSTGIATDLRLYWAWGTPPDWDAPDNPRWSFRGKPFLYKLYVSTDITGRAETANAASQEFLSELIPELNRTLFRSEGNTR